MRSRILITGAAGFVGTNALHYYASQQSVRALGLDVAVPRDPKLRDWTVRCDICDRGALRRVIEDYRPDSIVHLAARTDLDGKHVADYRANTDGVAALLDVAGEIREPPRILLASSRLVFAVGYNPTDDWDYQPSTYYGESKVLGEEIVRKSGYPTWAIVRPTSLWGPYFGVPYRNFFDAVRRGTYVTISGMRVRKSFGYVGNAIYQLDQLLCADQRAIGGRPFWISDYEPYVVDEWAEEIRRALRAPKIRSAPLWALKFAARGGDLIERTPARPPLTTFRLRNLTTDMIYDASGTERFAPKLPFSREAGVDSTVAWLRR